MTPTLKGRAAPQAAAMVRSGVPQARRGRAPPARPDQQGSAVRSRDRPNSWRSAAPDPRTPAESCHV